MVLTQITCDGRPSRLHTQSGNVYQGLFSSNPEGQKHRKICREHFCRDLWEYMLSLQAQYCKHNEKC